MGHVFFKRQRDGAANEPIHRVNRKARETNTTFIGFIADNAEINAVLPNVLRGNNSQLKVTDWQAYLNAADNAYEIVREESGWIDTGKWSRVITKLGRILQPFQDRFEFIVLWDAHKAHVHWRHFVLAGRYKMRLVVVPARLTWLMQPLDTHAFGLFKKN